MATGTGQAISREEIIKVFNKTQVEFLDQLQQHLTKYRDEKGTGHGLRVRVEADPSANTGSTPMSTTMMSCFNWKTGQWVQC